jgi:hypothetical protein
MTLTIPGPLQKLAGKAACEVENRLLNPTTGETVWVVHWTGRLIRQRGRAKLVGITPNITAEKQAELALHESEKRLREQSHQRHKRDSPKDTENEQDIRRLQSQLSGSDRRLGRVQGLLFRMKEDAGSSSCYGICDAALTGSLI